MTKKNSFNYLSIVTFIIMIFTGCSVKHDIPVKYNKKYMEGEIETSYSKINSKINIQKLERKQIKETKKWNAIATTILTVDQEFSQSVAKDFFSQYFKQVSISKKNALINFEIDLKNIKTIALRNQPTFEITFNVKFEKDNKVILNKLYTGISKSPFLIDMSPKYWFDLKTANMIYRVESIHRGLFKILETKVKPDLMKALKENI